MITRFISVLCFLGHVITLSLCIDDISLSFYSSLSAINRSFSSEIKIQYLNDTFVLQQLFIPYVQVFSYA